MPSRGFWNGETSCNTVYLQPDFKFWIKLYKFEALNHPVEIWSFESSCRNLRLWIILYLKLWMLCLRLANACLPMSSHDWKRWKTFENHEKVPFPSCVREAHVRLMKKTEEKSLLGSNWEWLPKAGWHPKTGCSFGILLFLIVFFSRAFHEPLVHMMKKVLFMFFKCFPSILTMRTHAQACVCWSKYTTAMSFPCYGHLLCLCEFTYSFVNVFQ